MINKDQWCNVLEFSRTILPDLSNYDEDGACKSIYLILETSRSFSSFGLVFGIIIARG